MSNPDAWRKHAACHPDNKPDDVTMREWVGKWWPPKGLRVDHLRAICAACPVLDDCAEDAITGNYDPDGFQGGLTARERQRARRERGLPRTPLKPINHGTAGGYQAHRRRGETPCDSCRAAKAADQRAWMAA